MIGALLVGFWFALVVVFVTKLATRWLEEDERMTYKRARELMEIERECVSRANTCGRDCEHCELVQDDKELISAYGMVIGLMDLLIRINNKDN